MPESFWFIIAGIGEYWATMSDTDRSGSSGEARKEPNGYKKNK